MSAPNRVFGAEPCRSPRIDKFAVNARDYDEYIHMLRADRAAAEAKAVAAL
jgi:hypothetical protein